MHFPSSSVSRDLVERLWKSISEGDLSLMCQLDQLANNGETLALYYRAIFYSQPQHPLPSRRQSLHDLKRCDEEGIPAARSELIKLYSALFDQLEQNEQLTFVHHLADKGVPSSQILAAELTPLGIRHSLDENCFRWLHDATKMFPGRAKEIFMEKVEKLEASAPHWSNNTLRHEFHVLGSNYGRPYCTFRLIETALQKKKLHELFDDPEQTPCWNAFISTYTIDLEERHGFLEKNYSDILKAVPLSHTPPFQTVAAKVGIFTAFVSLLQASIPLSRKESDEIERAVAMKVLNDKNGRQAAEAQFGKIYAAYRMAVGGEYSPSFVMLLHDSGIKAAAVDAASVYQSRNDIQSAITCLSRFFVDGNQDLSSLVNSLIPKIAKHPEYLASSPSIWIFFWNCYPHVSHHNATLLVTSLDEPIALKLASRIYVRHIFANAPGAFDVSFKVPISEKLRDCDDFPDISALLSNDRWVIPNQDSIMQQLFNPSVTALSKWRLAKLGSHCGYERVQSFLLQKYEFFCRSFSDSLSKLPKNDTLMDVVLGCELCDLYEIGVRLGRVSAMYSLGVQLYEGRFIGRNPFRALELLVASHKSGLSAAYLKIHQYYAELSCVLTAQEKSKWTPILCDLGQPHATRDAVSELLSSTVTSETAHKALMLLESSFQTHGGAEPILTELQRQLQRLFYNLPLPDIPILCRMASTFLSDSILSEALVYLENSASEGQLAKAFACLYIVSRQGNSYAEGIFSDKFDDFYSVLGAQYKVLFLGLKDVYKLPKAKLHLAWHRIHGIGTAKSLAEGLEILSDHLGSKIDLSRIQQWPQNLQEFHEFISQLRSTEPNFTMQSMSKMGNVSGNGLSQTLLQSYINDFKTKLFPIGKKPDLIRASEALLYGQHQAQNCYMALQLLDEAVELEQPEAILLRNKISDASKSIKSLLSEYCRCNYPDAYKIAMLCKTYNKPHPWVLMTLYALYTEAPLLMCPTEGSLERERLVQELNRCSLGSFQHACQEYDRALQLMQEDARSGHYRLYTIYALMLLLWPPQFQQHRPPGDHVALLRDAVSRGDGFAAYLLHKYHLSGHISSNQVNALEAERHLRFAADCGIATAQAHMCKLMLEAGNTTSAVEYGFKAAFFGDENCLYLCALHLRDYPDLVDSLSIRQHQQRRNGLSPLQLDTDSWTRMAALRGNVEAAYYLGLIHIRDALPETRMLGFQFLEISARDSSNTAHSFAYARCLFCGEGAARDVDKSLVILYELQRAGYAPAIEFLDSIERNSSQTVVLIINHMLHFRLGDVLHLLHRLDSSNQSEALRYLLICMIIEAQPSLTKQNPHHELASLRQRLSVLKDKLSSLDDYLFSLFTEDGQEASPWKGMALVILAEYYIWAQNDASKARKIYEQVKDSSSVMVKFKRAYFAYEYDFMRDAREVSDDFTAASIGGHALASIYLGVIQVSSSDASVQQSGVKYLVQSLSHQFPLPYFILSDCYYQGKGVEKDFQQSKMLLEKGKEIDQRLLHLKRPVHDAPFMQHFVQGLDLIAQGNLDGAMRSLYDSLEARPGFSPAVVALRIIYYWSPSLFDQKETEDVAAKFNQTLLKTAKAEIAAAVRMLDRIQQVSTSPAYQQCLGVVLHELASLTGSQDVRVDWMHKTLDLNTPPALYAYGMLLVTGRVVDIHQHSCERYFTQAVCKNHASAMQQLAIFLQTSTLDKSIPTNALSLMKSSAELQNPCAYYMLAEWIQPNSPSRYKQAIDYLTRAAKLGHNESKLRLAGLLLENGVGGKNETEASYWLKQCADQGSLVACHRYAMLHLSKSGDENANRLAVDYLLRAAVEGGLWEAYLQLIACAEKGLLNHVAMDRVMQSLQRFSAAKTSKYDDLLVEFRRLRS